MCAAKPNATNRIGIVAGGGGVVDELLQVLESKSQAYSVAAITDETDAKLKANTITYFKWGEIGRIISYFHDQGCKELILIGRINKRPDFQSIIGDPGTIKLIPQIIKAMSGGDDSLLQKVMKLIEAQGFKVIGIQDIASELLLGEGLYGYKKQPMHFLQDVEKGKDALKDLGKHDIGQALVIYNGRILAVEGAEGTDTMMRRIKSLRQEKRITGKKSTGLLLKAAKPNQDLRVDLPTIGPDTIELAAAAGLSGIVFEAGRVLVADQKETIKLAKRHKIFLSGEGGFRDE